MNKDKIRGRNFSKKEIRILLSLVVNYYDILNCKKTDGLSNKRKIAAWEEIGKDFNNLSDNGSRTPDQLRKFWDNYKRKKKQEKRQSPPKEIITKPIVSPLEFIREDLSFSTDDFHEVEESFSSLQTTCSVKEEPPTLTEACAQAATNSNYDYLKDECKRQELELIKLKIEKTKDEIDQQKMLSMLQEIKSKLEIRYLQLQINIKQN